ncbi:FusB/FusC family EF-G-binding protein [Paenibacillus sp. HJGM_3]|uniref:FusB/FusC family EF-G-binding protein n=1 Tax=Paenibacillus sp. HJGM_3 TaxID=3379816 RepID=UPI003859150E
METNVSNQTNQAYILNHQGNEIRKQIQKLIYAFEHGSEARVVEALRYSAETAIVAAMPLLSETEKHELMAFWKLNTKDDLLAYLERLSERVKPFPQLSEAQVRKLFPKSKKLKVPDPDTVPWSNMSYRGWTDVAAQKHYLVYAKDGRLNGIEGTFSSSPKANLCCMCNTPGTPETIGYYSVVCKPPAGASQDYYKAIGNYMCLDSEACNKAITDLEYLEFFFQEANTKWV